MTIQATELDMPLEARLKRLEETVQAMIQLLHQETTAVRAIDLQGFIALQDVKSDLFDIYQADIKALLQRRGDLKSLPEMVKERIRSFEKDLSIARIENMSALERAGKSFGRLRDRIVQVARDSVLRTQARYGASGMMEMNTRKAISTGVQDHA